MPSRINFSVTATDSLGKRQPKPLTRSEVVHVPTFWERVKAAVIEFFEYL